MVIQLKSQNAGGLEKGVNGNDALKWIHLSTIPIVINGQQVSIPVPDVSNHFARYFLLEYVKPIEGGGDRYNAILNQGLPEIAKIKGYSTFDRGERRFQSNRWYLLPDDIKQIHLGTKRHT